MQLYGEADVGVSLQAPFKRRVWALSAIEYKSRSSLNIQARENRSGDCIRGRRTEMALDPLLLSRLQFDYVISSHIIFLGFTIGLAAWLAPIAVPIHRRSAISGSGSSPSRSPWARSPAS